MKEIITCFLLVLASGFAIGYFIIRPLVAIGDIPSEIRKLRESVNNLSKIIKSEDK